MHVRDLLNQLGKAPVPPVLLFCPGIAPYAKESTFEPVLADRAVSRLVDAFVDPSMHDLAYSVFYADEAKVGEIIQEAQTVPFLVERRVVLVRGAEKFFDIKAEKKSPLEPLLQYLGSPCDTTLLMLVAGGSVDKRKRLYTLIKEQGGIVECPQLKEKELEAWVREEVATRGKQIDGAAVQALVQRTGSHLSDVNNALSVLASYVGEAPRIREEDVVAACADVAEESLWNLTDAIAASNPGKALHALHQLLDYGKQPDEIMGLINWLLESAYKASPETRLTLPSPFLGKKVGPLAEKLGVQKLKEACALCTKTHLMLRSTGVDKNLALDLLVIKLAVPRRRPGSAVAR